MPTSRCSACEALLDGLRPERRRAAPARPRRERRRRRSRCGSTIATSPRRKHASARPLAFLPYLLILSGFLGGAYLVIDATAGERERQSLEPLLATPAARGAIMSGKIAAALRASACSACC